MNSIFYQFTLLVLFGLLKISEARGVAIFPLDDRRTCLGRCRGDFTTCFFNNKISSTKQPCGMAFRNCIDTCQSTMSERELKAKRSCSSGCQGEYDACQTMINTPIDHLTCLEAKNNCFRYC